MEERHQTSLGCMRLDITNRIREKCLRHLRRSCRFFSSSEGDSVFLTSKLSLTDMIQAFGLSPSQANYTLRCSPCNQRLSRLSVVLAPAQQLQYSLDSHAVTKLCGNLLLCARRKQLAAALISMLQPVFQITDVIGSFGSSCLQLVPEKKSSERVSGVTNFPLYETALDTGTTHPSIRKHRPYSFSDLGSHGSCIACKLQAIKKSCFYNVGYHTICQSSFGVNYLYIICGRKMYFHCSV